MKLVTFKTYALLVPLLAACSKFDSSGGISTSARSSVVPGVELTASLQATSSSAEANAQAVQDAYLFILHRGANEGEVNMWVAFLQAGHSLSELHDAIGSSPEAQANANANAKQIIKTVFENMLGRDPSDGEAQNLLNVGRQGTAAVIAIVQGSPEYQKRMAAQLAASANSSPNPQATPVQVNAPVQVYAMPTLVDLFERILGRNPDATVSSAESGKSCADVARYVLYSDEAQSKLKDMTDDMFVITVFEWLLNRNATTEIKDFNVYTASLKNGTATRMSEMEGIITSQEFANRCAKLGSK